MTLQIPAALWDRQYAADLLRRYWSTRPDGTPAYTGSHFERLGGGGDRREVRNRFTTEDSIAVATLSVTLPARAALQVLAPHDPHHFTRLLTAIPADIELADADEEHVAEDSPAWTLWRALREVHGIGPVGAGKLLARKRPRLLPVHDAVVKKVFARPTSDLTFWSDVRTQLRNDKGALVSHLEETRNLSGIGSDISVLRVLDVAAWMHGKELGH
ncbi:DUF6308 family protein [Streptomyces kronopolitis]|uniref:DUF6308 family protein n=1 Tax=Streptomyces kronopolitis TaxID=1612435 RepID=UPI0034382E5A